MEKDPISLEASHASIATASVTIKVLKVDNRQLTQSTFRQLPKANLIDFATFEILGMVWGWVNYHVPGDDARHTQFGPKLCRCPVWVHNLQPLGGYRHDSPERHRAMMFQNWLLGAVNRRIDWTSPEGVAHEARWNALMETLRSAEQLYIAT